MLVNKEVRCLCVKDDLRLNDSGLLTNTGVDKEVATSDLLRSLQKSMRELLKKYSEEVLLALYILRHTDTTYKGLT